jgi:hypothetical protein
MQSSSQYIVSQLNGRNRRLLYEWQQLEQGLEGRSDITWHVAKANAEGLPISYLIDYHIHSICGVTDIERLNELNVENKPIYADHFTMKLDLPAKFPCVDGAPVLNFLTSTPTGEPLPHPWHPNIRFFGDFAGRVCLNADACGSYTDLAWYIDRVARYLRYEVYHAQIGVPPFPEDDKVADWVVKQGEPQGWIKKLHNQ